MTIPNSQIHPALASLLQSVLVVAQRPPQRRLVAVCTVLLHLGGDGAQLRGQPAGQLVELVAGLIGGRLHGDQCVEQIVQVRRQITVREVRMLGQDVGGRVVHLVPAAQQQDVAERLGRTGGRSQFQQKGQSAQSEAAHTGGRLAERQIVQRDRIEFGLGARRQIEQRLAGSFNWMDVFGSQVGIDCVQIRQILNVLLPS